MNAPQNGDKQIECVECKGHFFFTAGEQEFYTMRGFKEPRRCKDCRERRKATITEKR